MLREYGPHEVCEERIAKLEAEVERLGKNLRWALENIDPNYDAKNTEQQIAKYREAEAALQEGE